MKDVSTLMHKVCDLLDSCARTLSSLELLCSGSCQD